MHYTLPIFIYIFFTNFRQAFYFIIPLRLIPIILKTYTHPKGQPNDGKQDKKTKAKNRKKQYGKIAREKQVHNGKPDTKMQN